MENSGFGTSKHENGVKPSPFDRAYVGRLSERIVAGNTRIQIQDIRCLICEKLFQLVEDALIEVRKNRCHVSFLSSYELLYHQDDVYEK